MILAIIQARMASTRLPGKVMKEVLGKPLIGLMLERLKQSSKIDQIVVATSQDTSNDALAAYLSSVGAAVYRGSEDDVLDRFYQTALLAKPQIVVRLTADCPIIDPDVVDRAIAAFEGSQFNYVATASDAPGYPDGLDVEVFSFQSLENAWKNATLRSDREHVTPYIRKAYPEKNFYLRPETDHSSERWTVDEPRDFELVRGIIESLYPSNPRFRIKDVLELGKTKPHLFELNRSIKRNEGYAKSLKTDGPSDMVSIVVAVHNGERYLKEQLDSLKCQSYKNLEIIIMDDASADQSVAIAEQSAVSDARFRVVKNETKLGIVANFMKGVHLTKGSFVCFCDQDDIWLPGKVEALKAFLDRSPERMMAYSDLEICDASMNKLHASFLRYNKINALQGRLGEKSLLKNISPGCAMMFRRQVRDMISFLWQNDNFMRMNRADVLDETPVLHDHLAQIVAAGLGTVVFFPKALVKYRQHTQNSIGAFYPARRGKESFVRSLEARLALFTDFKSKLPEIRWERMERFLDLYRQKQRKAMGEQLGYFIYLRNHSWGDYLLAYLDCFFPSLYRSLKGLKA